MLIDTLELMIDPDQEEDDEQANNKIEDFLDEATIQHDIIEEYDGLNDNFGYFVVLANLDMLMRGHAIKIITLDRKVNIDVPGLYTLTINLPVMFDKENSKAYFDCTKRTLALILPLEGLQAMEDAPELISDPVEEKSQPKEITSTLSDALTSDQMLFDLV